MSERKRTRTNVETQETMKLVFQDPEVLKPYPDNSRLHPESQIITLANSMLELSFISPVVVDEDNTILRGHGSTLAAIYNKERNGYFTDDEGNVINFNTIPTVVKRGLNESQKRAYVIADNWLGEQSSWDQPTLDSQLKLLQDEDFDLELVGFVSDVELDAPEEIEDLPIDPIVPEVETQEKTFKITIDCVNKQDQDEQYERLIEQGFNCKISST